MNETRKDSGGIVRKESGTAYNVCAGIFASVRDTERPWREYVFTAADVRYLGSLACMIAANSNLRLILQKARNSNLASIAKE